MVTCRITKKHTYWNVLAVLNTEQVCPTLHNRAVINRDGDLPNVTSLFRVHAPFVIESTPALFQSS